jgi:hypothetical protein
MKSISNRHYNLDIPQGLLKRNQYIALHTLSYQEGSNHQFFFDVSIKSDSNPEEKECLVQFQNGRLVHGSLEDKLRLAVIRQLSFPKDSTQELRRDYSTIYQTLRTYPRIRALATV